MDKTILLHFETDGPPISELNFKISDYKLRNHGVYKFLLSEIQSQFVDLPFDLEKIKDGKALSCSAYCGNNKLDSIVIPVGDIDPKEAHIKLQEELEALYLEIEKLSPLGLLEKLKFVEGLDQQGIKERILIRMYSTRNIDFIRQEYKHQSCNLNEIEEYFKQFDTKWLDDIKQIPLGKLKLYCGLPVVSLKKVCARELVLRNECVGADHVIEDLLIPGKISWNEGLDILSVNRSCSAEDVRDRITWDKLELANDEIIDLMIALAEEFHPAVKRMAKEAIDWKKAIECKKNQTVLEVEVLGHFSGGVKVPFGLLTGKVPLDKLDQDLHGLRGEYKDAVNRLPRLVKTKIKVVVTEADRSNDTLIFSEKIAREKIAQIMLSELKKEILSRGLLYIQPISALSSI